MLKKPNDLIYAVNDIPPWYKLIPLSLQYALLMAVYLVIIVIVARASGVSDIVANEIVRVGLIALAVSTVLQSLQLGPIGSGFLAAPVISAIYLDPSLLAAKQGGLALVFGMTIYASLVEILFSRVLYYLRILFPPGISGFVVLIVGLQLGLVGVQQMLAGHHQNGLINWQMLIALITLATMIAASIWWKGTVRLMCSFIGIFFGFLLTILLKLVPSQHWQEIHHATWFALPFGYHFGYKFDWHLMVPFTVAGIAASLRTVGVISTCQKINQADWKASDLKLIQGGVLADGLGCFIGGILGSFGMNTAPSLVGVSQATGATSRVIGFVAALILVILSFIPKITAIILILPQPVIGAALTFTGSFMIIGGIQVIVSRNIDTRMTYVIGISLLLGISRDLNPQFFQHLPNIIRNFTSSGLTIAVTSALLLNLIFRLGIKRKAMISYQEKEIPDENIQNFFYNQCDAWKVFKPVSERAFATVKEIIRHIHDSHLVKGKIRISLVYDQIDLVVQLNYKGDFLKLPLTGGKKQMFLEEESFSYGLADFWNGIFPDKLTYSNLEDQIELKLYFAA